MFTRLDRRCFLSTHVRFLEQLRSRAAHTRVDDEHLVDERDCLTTNVDRELKLTSSNFLVKFFIAAAPERKLAAEHRIKEYSSGPNVRRRPRILALKHDLRAHIGRCATEYLQPNIWRCAATEAEVNQFDLYFRHVYYDVFKLDVTMRNISIMKVLKCCQQLFY